MQPIRDDCELVYALEALAALQCTINTSFMTLPETPIAQKVHQIKKLVRDYLNADKRLEENQ